MADVVRFDARRKRRNQRPDTNPDRDRVDVPLGPPADTNRLLDLGDVPGLVDLFRPFTPDHPTAG